MALIPNSRKSRQGHEIRGPERFYSLRFRDDIGFYPVEDLFEYPEWTTLQRLEFVMANSPTDFAILVGFGIFVESEDFWVFGRSREEVRAVAEEWTEEEEIQKRM